MPRRRSRRRRDEESSSTEDCPCVAPARDDVEWECSELSNDELDSLCDCGAVQPQRQRPCPAVICYCGRRQVARQKSSKGRRASRKKSEREVAEKSGGGSGSGGGFFSFLGNLCSRSSPPPSLPPPPPPKEEERKRTRSRFDDETEKCECLRFHAQYLQPQLPPPPPSPPPPQNQPIMLLVEPKVMRVLTPEELDAQEELMKRMGGVYKEAEEMNKAGKKSVVFEKIELGPPLDLNVPVVIIFGGPGSGKGTQCDKIVADFKFEHISTGDLLRNEVKSGSPMGKNLDEIMKSGQLVPLEPVLKLLKDEMKRKMGSAKGFLIDGYPRTVEQAEKFESHVCKWNKIIYFDVSDDTMMQRLKKRGESSGRSDDNEETIKKRIRTFHDESEPVISKYGDKLVKISAEGPPEQVYEEVKREMEKLVPKPEGTPTPAGAGGAPAPPPPAGAAAPIPGAAPPPMNPNMMRSGPIRSGPIRQMPPAMMASQRMRAGRPPSVIR